MVLNGILMGFNGIYMVFNGIFMGYTGIYDGYPLVNVYITNWKDPPFSSWVNPQFLWSCSIAMLNYQRVNWTKKLEWNMFQRLEWNKFSIIRLKIGMFQFQKYVLRWIIPISDFLCSFIFGWSSSTIAMMSSSSWLIIPPSVGQIIRWNAMPQTSPLIPSFWGNSTKTSIFGGTQPTRNLRW